MYYMYSRYMCNNYMYSRYMCNNYMYSRYMCNNYIIADTCVIHMFYTWNTSEYTPVVLHMEYMCRIYTCIIHLVPHMYILIQVGYLGIDVSPTSLSQELSILLFLLIFIMYKHITPYTIYYHSHTFSFMIYNFDTMHTAWCLTLYHNPIYCWALSIYSYFNLLPMPL